MWHERHLEKKLIGNIFMIGVKIKISEIVNFLIENSN
jgi:hypothetical protein